MSKKGKADISNLDITKVKVLLDELSKSITEKNIDQLSKKTGVSKDILENLTKTTSGKKFIIKKSTPTVAKIKQDIQKQTTKAFDILETTPQKEIIKNLPLAEKQGIQELQSLGIQTQYINPPDPKILDRIEAKEKEEEEETAEMKTTLIIKRQLIEDKLVGDKELVPTFKKAEFNYMPLKIDKHNPEIKKNIEEGLILGLSMEEVMNARGLDLGNLNRDNAGNIILLDQLIAEGSSPEDAMKKLRLTKWDIKKLERSKQEFLEHYKFALENPISPEENESEEIIESPETGIAEEILTEALESQTPESKKEVAELQNEIKEAVIIQPAPEEPKKSKKSKIQKSLK